MKILVIINEMPEVENIFLQSVINDGERVVQ